MKIRCSKYAVAFAALAASISPSVLAETVDQNDLMDRIEALEKSNAELIQIIKELQNREDVLRIEHERSADVAIERDNSDIRGLVGVAPAYGYKVLDHAEDVTTKRLLQLEARKNAELRQKLTVSGQISVLANYQTSNRDDKFGYLMRNPTSANQIGDHVSEAVVHSASLATTTEFTDSLTGYLELLYSPEQSFGSGTITSLERNQVQVRRAYLLYGNLDKSPYYAAIGKMDTPFGLNDTVNPFTNSTVWHSFSGLAYGAEFGYFKNGLSLRAMAIQGGAQFRAANTPVEGTNVPSRLNNFALDARYSTKLNNSGNLLVGASYQHGSPYCQEYPVFHFNPCPENNPAWSMFSKMEFGPLTLIGEYAQTTDVWPGSAVPDPTNPLSEFGAKKTKSFGLGGKFALDLFREEFLDNSSVSFEFSSFIAGDDGSPWERQNQWVVGYSNYLIPNVNLFSEYIHVEGFAPLNFLSGGNFPDGSTWSDRDARTDVLLVGMQAAF